MDKDLEELHNLSNTAFQNVLHLTPVVRNLVANAKTYQKSVQATCNSTVMFVESFQQVANAAFASEGSTKKLGEVIIDVVETFKEIENMKLELTKLFINEVIIPLESKAEHEINLVKSTQKSYNHENKIQTELTEKAISGASKYRKRSSKKKRASLKLEEKEKMSAQLMEEELKKLKKVREEGLRKALIDERRIYCFLTERMCAYGRGMVVYNNRISNFMNQRLPDWQQFIAKPTELPPESENIILNPRTYKMNTLKGSVFRSERKESLKRRKSFNNHFPTKYSTIDGRSSRGGSRRTLTNASVATSISSLVSPSLPRTPVTKSPLADTLSVQSDVTSGLKTTLENDTIKIDESENINDIAITSNDNMNGESPPIGLYLVPVDSPISPRSEYANVVFLPKNDENPAVRSLSFSGAIKKPSRTNSNETLTGNDVEDEKANTDLQIKDKEDNVPQTPIVIDNALLNKGIASLNGRRNHDEDYKCRLKALYNHEASDASQLTFQQNDIIIPVCEPTAGWQYGENEKTKKSGWFPAAFTEEIRCYKSKSNSVRKPPPVMAKKASLRKRSDRKLSVGVTQLVHPSETSVDLVRRGSLGVITHLPTSSSAPAMIHAITGTDDWRNQSNTSHASQTGTRQDFSTDDSFDDNLQNLTIINRSKNDHQIDLPAMPAPPPLPNSVGVESSKF